MNVCLMGTRCDTLMAVKYFAWDDAKNAKLKADRGIGFEEIVFHIEHGDLLDILEHPNPDRYAGQRIFVVQREDYVYLVPFVEDEHSVFLKTIIPSRKATKQYLGERVGAGDHLEIRIGARRSSMFRMARASPAAGGRR